MRDALPLRIAGRGGAIHFGGRIEIVVRHAERAGMSRTVVNEPSGTVSPLAIAHADLEHVGDVAAVLVARLRGDPEGAAEQIEVVDIGRADIDLQRVEHVLHIDAEELRLGAVDVEIDLRRRGLEQREDLRRRPASARRAP